MIEIEVNNENPYKQTNLESIEALDKTSRVTALNWTNTTGNELLIGRAKPVVKVYDTETNNYGNEITVSAGPVVGLAKFNDKLIAGLANGKIEICSKTSEFIETGDAMNRLRQCSIEPKLIATGGKERQNNLKVWNLENNECVFKTKNVPNDFLQLEVPIWDSDFNFIDANCLCTSSRYGYVRVYDMRKQRRPTLNFKNDKEQISYTCLTTHGNVVFSGTTTGIMHAFDLRKMKHILHTYKGFTGSISDVVVDSTGEHLCTASLDRFVRVHNSETTGLLYQCYVKSKATRVLLRECQDDGKDDDIKNPESNDEETQEQTVDDEDDDDDDDDDDDEFDAIFDNMEKVK